jgi:hypothetical protein
MHWIKATAPDGSPAFINLAAILSMKRVDEKGITMLFIGGVTSMKSRGEDGSDREHLFHANTQVKETPEALFALPKIEPAAMALIQAAKMAADAQARAPAVQEPASVKAARSAKKARVSK